MAWPLVLDYNEAIQNPKQCFADLDLREGQAATNAMGWPMPCTGNFAAVYKVTCPNQRVWAVKCFTREVSSLNQRYQAISDHLRQARHGGNLAFMVGFKYLDQGIRIKGQWYPVLKMDWVEGFSLNDFVKSQLDKPEKVSALAGIWLKQAQNSRAVHIAHGDLQHGNVLLVRTPKGVSLRLIDYDGMFVPALAQSNSNELGHANYQHPRRGEDPYHGEVDRFAHLVIYTALRCLAVSGRRLWDLFDNGENLLFGEADFKAPGSSELFRELWKLSDLTARALVGHLLLACQAPPRQVPLLDDLVAENQLVSINANQAQQVESLLSTRVNSATWGPIASPGPAVTTTLPPWLANGGVVSEPTLPAYPGSAEQSWPPLPLPRQGSAAEIRRFTGHTSEVFSVAFSPDGRHVLTGSRDNTAILWMGSTGQIVRKFLGHTDAVLSVAFSHDGRYVQTGSRDNTAILWELSTGQQLRAFAGHTGFVHSVAFSPDGNQVLTGSWDQAAILWESATGRKLRTFAGHTGLVLTVAFSPDGRQVLTGSRDQTAILWATATGQRLVAFSGHTNGVRSVDFSSDGRRVLTGSWDKTAVLWDAETGQKLRTFAGHGEDVLSVAFSPDGQRVLTGSRDGTAILWDAATGQQLTRFAGHKSFIFSVSISPDGRQFLTGSGDGTAILWGTTARLPSGGGNRSLPPSSTQILIDQLDQIGHGAGYRALPPPTTPPQSWPPTPSPVDYEVDEDQEDKPLWPPIPPASRKGSGSLWNKIVVTSIDHAEAIAFIVSVGSIALVMLAILLLASGTRTRPPSETRRFTGHSNSVTSVAFNPGGSQALTGARDNTAILWLSATEQHLRTLAGHTDFVNSVAFSPDGGQALTGSRDNTAIVWDLATGQKLRTFIGHTASVGAIAFSLDGRQVLTGSDDQTAILWDSATGRKLRSLAGHAKAVRSVAFSPDGRQVLTGSWDTTVILWESATGQQLRTFTGHTSSVSSVVFSPDGLQVLTGSGDHTAILWDLSTGQQVRTFTGHTDYVRAVAFSPDGREVLTGSEDKTAILWESATGQKLRTFAEHTNRVTSVAFSPDGQQVLTGSEDKTAILRPVRE